MSYKVAILSDIHGNLTALEAVINDAKMENTTDFWILGDLIMPGPGPSDLIQILRALPNALFVKGNWEDYFFEAPSQRLENAQDIFMGRLAQYHYENLNKDDIEFIRSLPLSRTISFQGLKITICHHLPNKNHGRELVHHPDIKQYNLLFKEDEIDFAIFGHTHHQLFRRLTSTKSILNPGTVGQNFKKADTAQYAILELDSKGFKSVKLKEIKYDKAKEIQRAQERNLPYFELYKELLENGETQKREILKAELESKYREETINFYCEYKTRGNE